MKKPQPGSVSRLSSIGGTHGHMLAEHAPCSPGRSLPIAHGCNGDQWGPFQVAALAQQKAGQFGSCLPLGCCSSCRSTTQQYPLISPRARASP